MDSHCLVVSGNKMYAEALQTYLLSRDLSNLKSEFQAEKGKVCDSSGGDIMIYMLLHQKKVYIWNLDLMTYFAIITLADKGWMPRASARGWSWVRKTSFRKCRGLLLEQNRIDSSCMHPAIFFIAPNLIDQTTTHIVHISSLKAKALFIIII